MKYLRRVLTTLKVSYYLFRLLLSPKNSIMPLLKLGNIISNSKAFDAAVEVVLSKPDAKLLVSQRYGTGIPEVSKLLACPTNSLGFALGTFMKAQKLDRYPIPIQKDYSCKIYLRERRRHIHDILHVVLGYDTSLEGEAKVNAFICGQAAFPIPVLISVGVLLISLVKFPTRTNQIYKDLTLAFQRGQNSPSIFGVPWEEKWTESLQDLQEFFSEETSKNQPARV